MKKTITAVDLFCGAGGKPMKSKKGATFQAFKVALESLGYRVGYRILNAADYGDPTCRKRLFLILPMDRIII